ncbi:MAG: energy transducer TonB [Myxococcota bacterium]|jgi:protein TonB|nr:energy transducer TonB [Myxococcota bacterium]
MFGESKGWFFTSVAFSLVVHGLVATALHSAPTLVPRKLPPVDLEVVKTQKPPPAPLPLPEEEKEPEPEKKEPTRPKAKPAEPPPPEPPPEPPPPDEQPKARPVFNLGDNTFAADGEGSAGWALARSEGNTKLAAVAKPGDESVRGTAPDRPQGEQGGTGKGLTYVPLKDLRKQPTPEGGDLLKPPYPRLAKENNIEGIVFLRLFIDETGAVRSVRIIKEPGFGTGEAAQEQAMRQRFTPALDKSGKPVATVIPVSYRFVLED